VNSLTADRYADNTFSRTNLTLASGNNTFTAVGKDNLGRQDSQSITVNLPSTVTYTYDLNGNLTYDGNRALDYDDENQLIRVTVTNNWKSEFTYDATMRRRIRKEFLWQNGGWSVSNEVHYVYDSNLVIQERDGNNVPTVSYTRGRDLSGRREGAGGIGGLLARTDYSTIIPQHTFYQADGNGNVTMLINSLQLIAAKYSYDPFGSVLSKSGPLADANVYRFSSKEAHPASGLAYYLYRFYDPNLQRWLNRDPLGDKGNSKLTMEAIERPSLYSFAHNEPIGFVDPDGRCLKPPPPCHPKKPTPGCASGYDSQWGKKPVEKFLIRRFRCMAMFDACAILCSDKYEDLECADKDCVEFCKQDCQCKLEDCGKGLLKEKGKTLRYHFCSRSASD